MQRSEDNTWKWVLFPPCFWNYLTQVIKEVPWPCQVSLMALNIDFYYCRPGISFKAWGFNYFPQIITEYSWKIFVIEHYILFSKAGDLIYFDSIFCPPVCQLRNTSFTYYERTKRWIPISKCSLWEALHWNGICSNSFVSLKNLGCSAMLHLPFILFCFVWDSLIGLKLTKWASLASQQVLGVHLSLTPQC